MATAEVKTKPTNLSVSKYLAAIKDPQRKRDCIELVKLMTASSGQKPRMWGTSIVGFGMRHVVSPSGREIDWMQQGVSSRKDSISLYIGGRLDQPVVIALLKKLGKHKRGVGCLYIKRLQDVDMKVLKKLLSLALDY